jgi:hypothetical protein
MAQLGQEKNREKLGNEQEIKAIKPAYFGRKQEFRKYSFCRRLNADGHDSRSFSKSRLSARESAAPPGEGNAGSSEAGFQVSLRS